MVLVIVVFLESTFYLPGYLSRRIPTFCVSTRHGDIVSRHVSSFTYLNCGSVPLSSRKLAIKNKPINEMLVMELPCVFPIIYTAPPKKERKKKRRRKTKE